MTAAVRPLCWRNSLVGSISSLGDLVPLKVLPEDFFLIERHAAVRSSRKWMNLKPNGAGAVSFSSEAQGALLVWLDQPTS